MWQDAEILRHTEANLQPVHLGAFDHLGLEAGRAEVVDPPAAAAAARVLSHDDLRQGLRRGWLQARGDRRTGKTGQDRAAGIRTKPWITSLDTKRVGLAPERAKPWLTSAAMSPRSTQRVSPKPISSPTGHVLPVKDPHTDPAAA